MKEWELRVLMRLALCAHFVSDRGVSVSGMLLAAPFSTTREMKTVSNFNSCSRREGMRQRYRG